VVPSFTRMMISSGTIRRMVILINGAFGIGKTTVARLLSQRIPGSVIFDPERIGFVLQRLPKLSGRPVEDFQDLRSWRRLSVLGVRAAAALRPHVIVPMAFSNLSYLQEIRGGIARFEPRVHCFCLVAPLPVVRERLRHRKGWSGVDAMEWQYRRAAECCSAHEGAGFGERVPAGDRTAGQVADDLLERLKGEQK
jgi:predicted kinase